MDPETGVARAGLDDGDPRVGIRTQPVRKHAAGRARPDDDKIEFLPGHVRTFSSAEIVGTGLDLVNEFWNVLSHATR
jgi:hypothetical protein